MARHTDMHHATRAKLKQKVRKQLLEAGIDDRATPRAVMVPAEGISAVRTSARFARSALGQIPGGIARSRGDPGAETWAP